MVYDYTMLAECPSEQNSFKIKYIELKNNIIQTLGHVIWISTYNFLHAYKVSLIVNMFNCK